MINFRYHLVSVAAIFIALAAGIALGSGPLDDASARLRGDAANAQSTDPALSSFESAYAGRTSGGLLNEALKGQSVVVLTVPGTSDAEVKGITADLQAAGAEVTGEVGLTAKLLDSSGRQFAEGVAQQAASDVPGVGAGGEGYGRVGAALGRALLADTTTPVDPTSTTIRSAFSEGNLLTLGAAPKKLATLAVLVAGPQRPDGSGQSDVISALAGALNRAGKGLVVAGPSSSGTDGGAVKAVRDGDSASEVSTVDVTNSAAGRVLTALATARQAGGQPGAWGTSRSADGALPAPPG
ncbi:copper transporter [Aeromicrobium sp.]|uniref:copper transporter n=1 Tax=Aeromicrobium sp. TaxID=1871063 RepID=UPI0019C82EF0|nr:copper transporter [Aeromicrobium sp.]MBC7631249.1 copper transporter [Aeromicrobium sp.]